MLKKIIASLIVLSFVLVPIGDAVFHHGPDSASARGYKSGVKSFNMNKGNSGGTHSLFQKKNPQTNKQKTISSYKKTANKSSKGGFLKGMLFGGLAGMLFGGLLSHFGALGSVLGMVINVLIIVVVIAVLVAIIRGLLSMIFKKNKQKEEEYNTWRK
ncbi:putative membrane protein [Scopulibacillus daqui]|uniref:Membrane protein n=1 Tax=Scopulibacillus daqui TaxID=1469162 RepID=A0ABS2Q0C4_9BACL|nr:hypothetical protein [Scopulibacillus daqui]MBM7645671.1 putative membrane protein [Scopulibacillus daqui]